MPHANPQSTHDTPNQHGSTRGAANRRGSTADADPEINETGTTTVALAAEDGAVVMADQRASAGGRFVTSKDTQKVEPVHPTAAVALSGTVGGLQSYTRRLRAQADQYEIRRGDPPSMHAFATVAGNLLRGGPYRMVRPVLAGVDGEGPHVYDLDGAGGVLEAPYAAKGSGTQFALGVLEREYRPDLSVADAVPVAARAVASAIERDTASGNGITVAEVTAAGVTVEAYDDPTELSEGQRSPESEKSPEGDASGEVA